ncbi:Opsin-5 [Acipenser ruthenus]|uniref:Opsin-5 n=1 Tax=Acipenser ruthenus TaxID=7906 RepID=A0A444U527_ACIRT|nr:Opsin-5 [Acipenser ruthenus]
MEDRYLSKLSPAEDYGAGAYLLVIAVLSVLGNVAVLVTALKRSSRLKPPELLSVNLAVTDLGMTISMYPLSIASAWNHRWLGGDGSCIYYGLMGFFFGVASILTLTMMAITRFIVTTNLQVPVLYVYCLYIHTVCTTVSTISPSQVTESPVWDVRDAGEKISKKNVSIMILFTWLYALMWAVFPLLGWGKYGPEPFGISCTIAWGEFKVNGSTFIVCIFTLCTVVPALTIIICYFGIAWKIHKAYKSMGNSNQMPSAMKIAVLVSVGFIGCWAPYAAVSLWSMFRSSDSIPPLVSLLPCLFAKSATAYNPFIYYIFSKSFRKEIKLLTCFCGKPDDLLNTVNMAENPVNVTCDDKRKQETTLPLQ